MLIQRLKLALAPTLWRLWTRSVRVPRGAQPPGAAGPVIYACLHRDMIPSILYVQPVRPTLLVSNSPDGDILSKTLAASGFGFARGSTGKDGGQAFVRLLAALREGHSVGIAVDGPRGPFGEVREGVIQLSRRSGCQIVPLLSCPGRFWKLGNWDRTVVPLPWSTVRIREGEPLLVPVSADGPELDRWRRRLGLTLLGGVDERAGRPPTDAGARESEGA
jgi:lysophospholipid acyltransferase (LPLAT)-like uncharacterized protein